MFRQKSILFFYINIWSKYIVAGNFVITHDIIGNIIVIGVSERVVKEGVTWSHERT